ncbi:CHASE domain-containing protein [Pyxidicoccus sp. MSG2]|uniref:CHASE domain-containing protein n=1 Tax=Pyxidicoccus sp. MSG2 TaxID=2996790 RepID=UPI00226EC32D|nr:CHASE domain-containing protein [Pyxidicoccus sp. MSG2]MCY1018980.1 CHASE domain-containing protein [Pyxidicoccus sp. MSG2]
MPALLSSHLRRHASAYCALLVGLAVTGVAALYVQRGIDERRDRRFDESVREGTLGFQQRIDMYQAMLLGTRGLFSSSQKVERDEFHAYVESLELNRRYPGVQGIGFSQWLKPGRLKAHEAEVRAEGFPDYHLWPEGERAEYTAIVFMEPLDAHNRRAIGFDMFSEPTRQEAMRRALETALPAASGTVRLEQEDEADTWPPQAGFLIYVPVYNGTPPTPPEDRRASLRGFVFAPFRMGDLMEGLRFPGFQDTVDLAVHDGADASPETLFFTSRRNGLWEEGPRLGLRREVAIAVAGRRWTLVFTARESFIERNSQMQLSTVVLSGLLVTLLLFLMTRAQVNARAAAEAASTEQQRLASEARTAVRVRDEFLGVAAHELRTPLTSLKLQLQLLYRQLRQPGPLDVERVARGVESCERQTTRLSQLVDSLLDVSRLMHGRMELRLEPLELGDVVRELVRRFETDAQSVGVLLTVDAPEPVRGRWDRLRLEQVLTNLVSNALKYGQGTPVDVRVRGDGSAAFLEVRDRGIGIAREDAERIFDRFERAVSSRHYGGLGLGLFITRQLVEALGGSIAVESLPGQGSTFTVRLPVTGPGEEAEGPAPASEPPRAPLH